MWEQRTARISSRGIRCNSSRIAQTGCWRTRDTTTLAGNIPLSANEIIIYPGNVNIYTPALHRLLQLAANIYDASGYKTDLGTNFDYPSVFRPLFGITPIPWQHELRFHPAAILNDPPDLTANAAYNVSSLLLAGGYSKVLVISEQCSRP